MIEERDERVDPVQPVQPVAAGAFRRISWGAILAGVVIALAIQMLFSLLGLAIGFWSIDPVGDPGMGASGFGTGAGIWWVVTSLISLFLAGWVAGRTAGVPRRFDGLLHGLLAWAVATLLTVWLMGSAVGAVVSGVMGTLGHGVEALAQQSGSAIQSGAEDIDLDSVVDEAIREARRLLRDTGQPELQPENLEQEADEAAATAREGLARAARQPGQAGEELERTLDRLMRQTRDVRSAADREAAANTLAENTDMSQEEAEQTVQRWERQAEEAQQRLEGTGERFQEAAGEASDRLAPIAFWTFFALLVGAAAAGAGGAVGAPRT